MLSGNDLLASIERMLEDTRGELESVASRLEVSSAKLVQLRQAEIGVLAVLARVRLREIEHGELAEALDETGRQVADLLGQREQAQAALGVEIAAAQAALAKLQERRTAQHATVDDAEKAVDAAEAEAQRNLAGDATYRATLAAADKSDAVADLAEKKAAEARTDRTAKGKPYEADPLFMYLWQRGYGTGRYSAAPVTRMLDKWVARTVDFEPLRRNYWSLCELPARFDEHALRMRKTADDDVAAVRELERAAAAAAGVPERERALTAATEALAGVDKEIEAQDAAIATLVEKRGRFASGDDDLTRRAMDILAETFRQEKMRTLRERANRSESREDDAAVDQLTAIRADKPRLEQEVARLKSLHDTHTERTTKLEDVRKRFKEARYDAVTSEFLNSALIAGLLSRLLSGAIGVPAMWDALKQQQRFRNLAADPRFGSGRFPRGRGGPWGGGGWGGGGWGGGRRGGFGGGGFGSGGGFGGGGFKTGGGF
jgi:hypothetical protein